MQIRVLYFKEKNVLNFKHISVISNVLKPPYHETMPRQVGLRHILQLHGQKSKNHYSDLIYTFNKVVICQKRHSFRKRSEEILI
jgi:hypothetical protein